LKTQNLKKNSFFSRWQQLPKKIKNKNLFIYLFRAFASASARTQPVRADSRLRPQGRGRGGRGGEGMSASASCVCTYASVLSPGNFITNAIVCPSHGRPSGHRPTIRSSVCPFIRYCPHDNPGSNPPCP
jgi:hypothetical protein